MMRPDHRAIDHVGASVALDHLGQRLKQGIKHPGLDPVPVAPEHAVLGDPRVLGMALETHW